MTARIAGLGSPILAAVLGAALVAVLAGCGAEDGSAPAGTPVPSASDTATNSNGNAGNATEAQVEAARLPPCPSSSPDVPAVSNGLPDDVLACLGRGPAVRLAGLRGTPMVINIWASWCGPCQKELPVLAEVNSAANGSVRFLGIDMADDRVAALRMSAAKQVGYPSVQDPDSTVRAGLRVVGVPTTLFVRADGTVAGRTGVVTDAASLRSQIDRYLNVRVP